MRHTGHEWDLMRAKNALANEIAKTIARFEKSNNVRVQVYADDLTYRNAGMPSVTVVVVENYTAYASPDFSNEEE